MGLCNLVQSDPEGLVGQMVLWDHVVPGWMVLGGLVVLEVQEVRLVREVRLAQ